MSTRQIIEADLTWIGGSFERGVRLAVGNDGRIEAVGSLDEPPTLRLHNRALMPGFVNAHSHAFQRGLRGRGETFPDGAGSFWTWRDAMYRLVERMDEQFAYDLSKQAFNEMVAAGVTAVGEFHYLHHDASERGYALDEAILRAAADVGIRIVLLQAYYTTGGIGRPLAGGQKRFGSPNLDIYWRQFDHLAELIDPATQSLGVVAHSIRAVTMDDLVALHREAQQRGLPFHMHVEEQPAEIEACLRAHHAAPAALLNERLTIDPRFTAVHCTHTTEADMERYLAAGGNVCICPLTEANLGDGLANVPFIRKHSGRICLGSDSNARIDMIEEMRLLEYGQRLKSQTRGVVRDDAGSVAAPLLEMATLHGARSLGLDAGAIEAGRLADFALVDLTAPALAGWTDGTLLDALIFGATGGVIAGTCVGGRWIAQRRAAAAGDDPSTPFTPSAAPSR